MARNAGFTLIEIMLVTMIIAILIAIAIPDLLRSRIAANETSAVGALRSISSAQASWRQTDADRNTISDYWTADVSGLYRIERLPAGSGRGLAAIDEAFAAADDAKEGGGAALAGAVVPGAGVTAASLLALPRTSGRSGYLFQAMAPYETDPDGNGQAWTNLGQYGFQARPEIYDSSGLNTFIVNEAGVIFGQDFGNNLAGNAAAWPGPNPAAAGWRVVQ